MMVILASCPSDSTGQAFMEDSIDTAARSLANLFFMILLLITHSNTQDYSPSARVESDMLPCLSCGTDKMGWNQAQKPWLGSFDVLSFLHPAGMTVHDPAGGLSSVSLNVECRPLLNTNRLVNPSQSTNPKSSPGVIKNLGSLDFHAFPSQWQVLSQVCPYIHPQTPNLE